MDDSEQVGTVVRDRFTIQGWEDIAELVRDQTRDVSYLTVAERLGTREEQLAKVTVAEMPSWASDSDQAKVASNAMSDLARELRGQADGARSSYRVHVYGPKGVRLLTRTVTVLDAEGEPSGTNAEAVMAEVGAQGAFALGTAWQQFTTTVMSQTKAFGDLCLKQMAKVDEISRTQAELTAKETAAARQQVNELVAMVAQAKMSEAEARAELLTVEADETAEAKRTETGQLLARDAINKLGELGQAFLVGKAGVPPELAEVLTSLQSNPEMVEALRDPKVREQLKSADNLSYLATMLKHAAAVAAEQAAQATTPADEPDKS